MILNRIHLIAVVVIFYCSIFEASAGITNDIPSCYDANKVTNPQLIQTEVFLLVDQTTSFNRDFFQKNVIDNFKSFLKPGNAFVISIFSSFSQGKYTEIVNAGTLEAPISDSERDSIGVGVLKSFDACMAGQLKYAARIVQAGLVKASSGNPSDLLRSDVLAGLRDLSARVSQSKAKQKIVLIASDMLENSSISSFYLKQGVRQINPEDELVKVSNNKLFGDFGGAKVYVVGAGLIAEDLNKDDHGQFRSQQVMQSLFSFWATWFKRSNAQLIEFGQPALLNPVR